MRHWQSKLTLPLTSILAVDIEMDVHATLRRVHLPPRSEHRIELDAGEAVAIRFVPDPISGHYGDAEVFGAPLVAGSQERWYTFGNEAKFAISSWGGAEVEILGAASTEYMADEPSPTYTYCTNLHLNLERARIRAREQLRTDPSLQKILEDMDVSERTIPASYEQHGAGASGSDLYRAAGQGPRVMIVGPESAGKTSLIKFLANYALRSPALANVKEGDDASRRAKDRSEPEMHPGPDVAHDDDDDDDDENRKDDEESGVNDMKHPKNRKKHGSADSQAKKTLSDITGWWPMIVALDPSEGAVPVPGCVSAIPLTPMPTNWLPSPSPALPYGITTQTTGTLPPSVSTVQSVMPVSLWMGKENVRENERHSRRVIDWLAYYIEKRLVKDWRARMSGLLLDMPGVITADARTRYGFIQYCVRAFKIDTIVVLGHEKLNLELTRIYANDTSGHAPRIVKVPRSGGAVEVDEVYKQKLHDLQIRSYFYGMPPALTKEAAVTSMSMNDENTPASIPAGLDEHLGAVPTLSPYSTTIPLDLLSIYRVGQDRVAPSSALPIGAERVLSEMQVVKLDPVNSSSDMSMLLHSVLALVEPPPQNQSKDETSSSDDPGHHDYEDDELLGAAILGFVHVYVRVQRCSDGAVNGTTCFCFFY